MQIRKGDDMNGVRYPIPQQSELKDLLLEGESRKLFLAGRIENFDERASQKGSKYGFIELRDKSGLSECIVFSDVLMRDRDKITPGNDVVLFLSGNCASDGIRLTCLKVFCASDGEKQVKVLNELLSFVKSEGRVCPMPDRWNDLWKMLPDPRSLPSGGWEPPLPLILGAWSETSSAQKQERLEEHILWAVEKGVIDAVDAYLRGLPEKHWFYLGSRK
jgi:hypothetical protein